MLSLSDAYHSIEQRTYRVLKSHTSNVQFRLSYTGLTNQGLLETRLVIEFFCDCNEDVVKCTSLLFCEFRDEAGSCDRSYFDPLDEEGDIKVNFPIIFLSAS